MIPQVIFISLVLLIAVSYHHYKNKVSIPVKKEMDFDYVDSLIEKALQETETDIK